MRITKTVLLLVVVLAGYSVARSEDMFSAPATIALLSLAEEKCNHIDGSELREAAITKDRKKFLDIKEKIVNPCRGYFLMSIKDVDTEVSISIDFYTLEENSWEIIYALYQAKLEKILMAKNLKKTINKANGFSLFLKDDQELTGLHRGPTPFRECLGAMCPAAIEMSFRPDRKPQDVVNRIKAAINNLDKLEVH